MDHYRGPTIDHTLLGPSGRCSKRARNAAIARETAKLFPPGFWDVKKSDEQVRAEKIASLLNSAKNLRDVAARGMKVRAFTKAAEKLEAEARAL